MTALTDPCAKLEELYAIRTQLAAQTGKAVKLVEVEGAKGSRQKTEFHAADVKLLNDEIRRLEEACARKKGHAPRRAALRFS